MPYIPQVADTLTGEAWFTIGSQAAVCTQHLAVLTVAGGGVTQQKIAAFLDNLWSTTYVPFMSNGWLYNGYRVQKINPPPRVPPEASIAGSGIGGVGSGPLPPQLAALITFQSGIANKGGKPRLYVPGIPDNALQAGGTIGGVYITKLTLLATSLVGTFSVTFGGSTTGLAFASYNVRLALTTILPGVQTVATKVATQRRRSFFGRPNVSPI